MLCSIPPHSGRARFAASSPRSRVSFILQADFWPGPCLAPLAVTGVASLRLSSSRTPASFCAGENTRRHYTAHKTSCDAFLAPSPVRLHTLVGILSFCAVRVDSAIRSKPPSELLWQYAGFLTKLGTGKPHGDTLMATQRKTQAALSARISTTLNGDETVRAHRTGLSTEERKTYDHTGGRREHHVERRSTTIVSSYKRERAEKMLVFAHVHL